LFLDIILSRGGAEAYGSEAVLTADVTSKVGRLTTFGVIYSLTQLIADLFSVRMMFHNCLREH